MKISSFFKTIPMVICFSFGLLNAGTIPGRWEKLDSQIPTTGLTVFLKSGERINCFFKESDSETLTVVDPVAGERRLQKSGVDRVETSLAVRDSAMNGTLIGFGIGAGGYLGIHAVIIPLQDHDFPSALIFGGIGALVGFLVDRTSQGPDVLYVSK